MLTSDFLWEILLETRKLVAVHNTDIRLLSVLIHSGSFKLEVNYVTDKQFDKQIIFTTSAGIPSIQNTACFLLGRNYEINLLYNNNSLNQEEIDFLILLLPVCFLPLRALKMKRAVSVLHLAQSLDGKIATLSGNSKWISNDENLIYVHRLRALCDGILIGAKTLNKDNPALTVRHVKGPNPVKIVLGNSANNFVNIVKSHDKILHLVSKTGINHSSTNTICLEEQNHAISPVTILEELFKLGILSVYIEGGAYTASHFLMDGAVNLINIYIAPKIFGSGIGIELPEIKGVDECVSISRTTFSKMGEGILVQGFIN